MSFLDYGLMVVLSLATQHMIGGPLVTSYGFNARCSSTWRDWIKTMMAPWAISRWISIWCHGPCLLTARLVYILTLIWSVLFHDKSGINIHLFVLHLLSDLEEVGTFLWDNSILEVCSASYVVQPNQQATILLAPLSSYKYEQRFFSINILL